MTTTKQIDFQEIMTWLESNTLTPVQTNRLIAYIKGSRNLAARRSIRQFAVRDVVEFDDKHGGRVRGAVTKIGTKCIYVTEFGAGIKWRVAATLCTRIRADELNKKPG